MITIPAPANLFYPAALLERLELDGCSRQHLTLDDAILILSRGPGSNSEEFTRSDVEFVEKNALAALRYAAQEEAYLCANA